MKNNSGITLVTLIITIIALIILTSVFMATGTDSLEEAKQSEIKNEMQQLKQAVISKFTSYQKNDGNVFLNGESAKNKWGDPEVCVDKIIESLIFEEDTTFEEKNAKIQKITKEVIRDYDTFVRVIYSGDKVDLGIDNYATDYVYIVNYNTGAVYGPISE